MARVQINPILIQWAIQRSGRSVAELQRRFPKLHEWEQATVFPTMKQLEQLAVATRTPLGYFFLSSPPEDKLPIPDLRTVGNESLETPSPDLLETVENMQRRQAWMRDFLIEEGQSALPFINSVTDQDSPKKVAETIKEELDIKEGWANSEPTWSEALRTLRYAMEDNGIMVAVNGIVGNNTHRKLDVEEFRGFALVDNYAPLIFINGSDAKAAQMFTYAHELAHLWIGKEGVSQLEATQSVNNTIEKFCNKVAAEFLLPTDELEDCWQEAEQYEERFQFLARRFKVSQLVAARRALDMRYITKNEFFEFYRQHKENERISQYRRGQGGNFWNTARSRIGEYFGSAVVQAAREGRLLYRDAYELTGLRGRTFDTFATQLGY